MSEEPKQDDDRGAVTVLMILGLLAIYYLSQGKVPPDSPLPAKPPATKPADVPPRRLFPWFRPRQIRP
jgi:hypothetical protein